MEAQDFNWKNILKINGFKKIGNKYERDDGMQINTTSGVYNIVFGDGSIIYCETKKECIGELVLRNIINRLF